MSALSLNEILEHLRIAYVMVINLDRRRDRWGYVSAHLRERGLQHFTRVSAVDGRALPAGSLDLLSARARALIQRRRRWHHEEMHELGSVGAALSHLGLWQRLADTADERWLILEDDIRIEDSLEGVVGRALAEIPDRFDALLLGHHANFPGCEPVSEVEMLSPMIATSMRFYGSHAYALSASGAAVLAARARPLWIHVDQLISHLCHSREVDGYFVIPSVVSQLEDIFGSDIISATEASERDLRVTFLPWGRFPDQTTAPPDDDES
ncbi:MAG TPA: glycosyltransferase family 25 protein [Haliangium sp.]|nr:glycosyltransferase family 25 protein [Haliangium sp.]